MDRVTEILKKIRHLEIRSRRKVDAAFAGQYHSVFKGRGMNFQDVREYQPGDEIRSIDWNVTARTGSPHVKNFTEERELTLMLVVDISPSGIFGSGENSKLETAAEAACLLAFSAIRNNDKVGLLLFSDKVEKFIPPRKGRQHVLRLIREILYHECSGKGTDIASTLDYLNRILPRRSIVFLISDFDAPDFERSLSVTAQRHDLVAVHVVDAAEESLPDAGLISLEDPESGEQFVVDTSDPETRASFSALSAENDIRLSRIFVRNQIDSIYLPTDKDCTTPLRHFFEKRERRIKLS